MVGRSFFTRQAATLLKFAKSTNNPDLAAVLIEKAADFKSQVETMPPDPSHLAPDVDRLIARPASETMSPGSTPIRP